MELAFSLTRLVPLQWLRAAVQPRCAAAMEVSTPVNVASGSDDCTVIVQGLPFAVTDEVSVALVCAGVRVCAPLC